MRFETVCFVFEIPPLDIYFERYDMGLLIKNGYKFNKYFGENFDKLL